MMENQEIRERLAVLVLVNLGFLLIGFLLLHGEFIGYGISFFVFLPFILGYVFGNSTIKMISFLGLVISLITFFSLLIVGELEGMVCILMAMPLIIAALGLGALVKYFVNKFRNKNEDENIIKSSIFPLCLFLFFGFAEKALTEKSVFVMEVKTEIVLPNTPMEVYETIKSVDTLDAEKPFLMKLDLPIPLKCVLEKEEVGGLRTCYFEGGQIIERVTELEKGKILKMDVIDYQLTGRKWLGFKEAIYLFKELENGHCQLTRITTYTSELYPRFYWQPLEKIGIEQEHDYVFRNLKKDLKIKYDK